MNFNKISPSLLLSLYLLCPILLLICFVDIYIFDSHLLSILPAKPEEFAIWVLIFSSPHIMSSFVTLADKGNIVKYRFKVFKAILVLVALIAVLLYIIPMYVNGYYIEQYFHLMTAIFGFAMIYHVITQQLGIGLILNNVGPNLNFKIFKWISVIVSYVIYITMLLKPQIILYNSDIMIYLYSAYTIILIISIYFCKSFLSISTNKKGKLYMYSNIFMIFSVLVLSMFDYVIFALMIPRAIHDITAFIFYASHDRNKFEKEKSNYIYRALSVLPVSIMIWSPLIGISIAFAINNSNLWIAVYIIFLTDFLHYYIESFIWKGKASHREFIVIKQ